MIQDGNKQKMRIQMFYSILGLDQTKAFDIIIDEKLVILNYSYVQKTIGIRQEADCKKTVFNKSIMAISYFFYLFDSLTDYKGVEDQ